MEKQKQEADQKSASHHGGMIVGMSVCIGIGLMSLFYANFWLEFAFVVTMGFCIGHHLFHHFKHRGHPSK